MREFILDLLHATRFASAWYNGPMEGSFIWLHLCWTLKEPGRRLPNAYLGLADRRVHVIVLPASEPSVHVDSRPISESLAEVAAMVQANDVNSLPGDFTDQLDHYLYGSPKQ